MALPKVFGYQCGSDTHVPNTLPALRSALMTGADALVVDVELTRDGVLVVCDDRLLRATSARFHGTREATWAQLSTHDGWVGFAPSHPRVPIPRLETVLEEFEGRCELVLSVPMFVEDEAPQRAAALATALVNVLAWTDAEVSVASDSLRFLDRLARLDDEIRRVYRSLGPASSWPHLGVRDFGVESVGVQAGQVTPADRDAADDADLRLLAFDCQTPGAAERATAARVDAIATERPAWLSAWLLERFGPSVRTAAPSPSLTPRRAR